MGTVCVLMMRAGSDWEYRPIQAAPTFSQLVDETSKRIASGEIASSSFRIEKFDGGGQCVERWQRSPEIGWWKYNENGRSCSVQFLGRENE